MKIDHIALYVNDLEGARAFFETYFHAAANEGYHNARTDFRSYFLTFSDGSRMELMTKPDLTDSGNLLDRFGYAHIAFSVGSKEAVNELTEQLKAGGFPALSGPRVTGDGYYESSVLGFEGNILEITV